MSYDFLVEKGLLAGTDYNLCKMFKRIGKTKVFLSAIGNSISNGFSLSEPGGLLLDRNPDLKTIGRQNGVSISTYHLTRSENNNSLIVCDWVRQNFSEADCYAWNVADYVRFIEQNKTLLSLKQIDATFKEPSKEGIQSILKKKGEDVANIVVLNLGVGSFLDILTRGGNIFFRGVKESFYKERKGISGIFEIIKNIRENNPFFRGVKESLERDRAGIISILEMIQSMNRRENANIQVYLCGVPRIGFMRFVDSIVNKGIRKIARSYANVTYISSFPRKLIYKKRNGGYTFDVHYNNAEYLHLLRMIEENVITMYSVRDAMIAIDAKLFEMSLGNEAGRTKYTLEDVVQLVSEKIKAIDDVSENLTYNEILKIVTSYIVTRFPYDFYRITSGKNFGKIVYSRLKK